MKPGVISLSAIFLGTSSALAQPMPYKSEDCSGYTVQTEMIACAERNYEAADAALNQLFRQVLGSEHNPTARSRLVAEERTWVIMKEKRCAAEAGPREKGGSIWPLENATCQQRETNARMQVFRRYRPS